MRVKSNPNQNERARKICFNVSDRFATRIDANCLNYFRIRNKYFFSENQIYVEVTFRWKIANESMNCTLRLYNNIDHLRIRFRFDYSQAKELGHSMYTSIRPTFVSSHERACLRGRVGRKSEKISGKYPCLTA